MSLWWIWRKHDEFLCMDEWAQGASHYWGQGEQRVILYSGQILANWAGRPANQAWASYGWVELDNQSFYVSGLPIASRSPMLLNWSIIYHIFINIRQVLFVYIEPYILEIWNKFSSYYIIYICSKFWFCWVFPASKIKTKIQIKFLNIVLKRFHVL